MFFLLFMLHVSFSTYLDILKLIVFEIWSRKPHKNSDSDLFDGKFWLLEIAFWLKVTLIHDVLDQGLCKFVKMFDSTLAKFHDKRKRKGSKVKFSGWEQKDPKIKSTTLHLRPLLPSYYVGSFTKDVQTLKEGLRFRSKPYIFTKPHRCQGEDWA